MEYVTIVVMLALLQYMYFGVLVGRARSAAQIDAPAVVGDDNFERHFRAHQNTLEQLMIFVPATLACGIFVNGMYVAIVGLVFIVGRGMYFNRYVHEPTKRGPGMLMTAVANLALIFLAIISAVTELF
jgi:glutathione S-transferase